MTCLPAGRRRCSLTLLQGGATKKSAIFEFPLGAGQVCLSASLLVTHVHKVRITPRRLAYKQTCSRSSDASLSAASQGDGEKKKQGFALTRECVPSQNLAGLSDYSPHTKLQFGGMLVGSGSLAGEDSVSRLNTFSMRALVILLSFLVRFSIFETRSFELPKDWMAV